MECISLVLRPLTWSLSNAIFIVKYVLRTLRGRNKDKFMDLELCGMYVSTCETKLHAFPR